MTYTPVFDYKETKLDGEVCYFGEFTASVSKYYVSIYQKSDRWFVEICNDDKVLLNKHRTQKTLQSAQVLCLDNLVRFIRHEHVQSKKLMVELEQLSLFARRDLRELQRHKT